MAVVARYLADTSALARLHHPSVAVVLAPLLEAGLVATCGVVESEVLWSTRTAEEFTRVRADRSLGYERLLTEDEDWGRAVGLQEALWHGGRVRAVGMPDLLIAAVAERSGVTVLHYDSDFDLIASVSSYQSAWVVARGSVS